MIMRKQIISLPRAVRPEQVGIPSQAIIDAVNEFEAIGYEYHSMMFIRNGVVAAECYRYPFSRDMTHCMYSVSKNVTATALGFAVCEGKVSLSTKISDIFPDKYPSKRDRSFEQLTLLNLVTMTSGKSPSYLLNKSKGDWYRHFSEAPRVASPGEKFQYVNECSYLLSASLRRVLGMGINDYLVPRLWNPLGIEKPYWETDPNGIEAGGWGLQMRLEDMAKLALCYLDDGMFMGEQIIPLKWVSQAKLNQTQAAKGGKANRSAGYGYSVWRQGESCWRFDGMYGQTAITYEDKRLICLLNSGEMQPDRSFEIFSKVADACTEPDLNAVSRNTLLDEFLADRPIDIYEPGALRSELEGSLSGKTLHFANHLLLNTVGFPPSILPPTSVYMSKDRAGNINDISFDFNADGCYFSWHEGNEHNIVFCPMNGSCAMSDIVLAQIPFTACCAARWLDESTLEVSIRPMQSVAKRTLTFSFSGKRVTMQPSFSPSIRRIIDSITGNVSGAVKNEHLRKGIEGAMGKLDKVMEPVSKGVIR